MVCIEEPPLANTCACMCVFVCTLVRERYTYDSLKINLSGCVKSKDETGQSAQKCGFLMMVHECEFLNCINRIQRLKPNDFGDSLNFQLSQGI